MEEMGNMIAEVTKETKSVEITEVAGVANYIKDAISESLLEGVVKLDFPGNIKTETPPQKKEKKTSAVFHSLQYHKLLKRPSPIHMEIYVTQRISPKS